MAISTKKAKTTKAPVQGAQMKVLVTPAMAANLGILKRKAPRSAWKKGKAKTGGRKKGTPNKFDGTMKQAVMEAFQKLGGPDFLVRIGKSKAPANKRAMIGLFSKMIPMEVSADVTGAIVVQVGPESKDI